jgi:hypothetical protein
VPSTDLVHRVDAAVNKLEKLELQGLSEDLRNLTRQAQATMKAGQQALGAISDLPVIRDRVKDPLRLLDRPQSVSNVLSFAEHELFAPGSAILTDQGQHRLLAQRGWLTSRLAHDQSELVVVSYALRNHPSPSHADNLTKQQAETVLGFLNGKGMSVQKKPWVPSWTPNWVPLTQRKTTALGMGTDPAPVEEHDRRPRPRIEIWIFYPPGK